MKVQNLELTVSEQNKKLTKMEVIVKELFKRYRDIDD